VKAGKDALALQVDDSCLAADQWFNRLVTANGEDPAMPDGQSLRFGMLPIHRPNLAVMDDEVGGDGWSSVDAHYQQEVWYHRGVLMSFSEVDNLVMKR
jgi:hypothetical protein